MILSSNLNLKTLCFPLCFSHSSHLWNDVNDGGGAATMKTTTKLLKTYCSAHFLRLKRIFCVAMNRVEQCVYHHIAKRRREAEGKILCLLHRVSTKKNIVQESRKLLWSFDGCLVYDQGISRFFCHIIKESQCQHISAFLLPFFLFYCFHDRRRREYPFLMHQLKVGRFLLLKLRYSEKATQIWPIFHSFSFDISKWCQIIN